MCYVLSNVFVHTPEGLVEFKVAKLDQYLLECQANPPAECHFNHPMHFLTPSAHNFILTQIATAQVGPALFAFQAQARQLLPLAGSKIHFLNNTSFIFFPRWYEDGVLCRQLGLNGDEMAICLDSVVQPLSGMCAIDLKDLVKTRVDNISDTDSNNTTGSELDTETSSEPAASTSETLSSDEPFTIEEVATVAKESQSAGSSNYRRWATRQKRQAEEKKKESLSAQRHHKQHHPISKPNHGKSSIKGKAPIAPMVAMAAPKSKVAQAPMRRGLGKGHVSKIRAPRPPRRATKVLSYVESDDSESDS